MLTLLGGCFATILVLLWTMLSLLKKIQQSVQSLHHAIIGAR